MTRGAAESLCFLVLEQWRQGAKQRCGGLRLKERRRWRRDISRHKRDPTVQLLLKCGCATHVFKTMHRRSHHHGDVLCLSRGGAGGWDTAGGGGEGGATAAASQSTPAEAASPGGGAPGNTV
jgi:hypothetical protein